MVDKNKRQPSGSMLTPKERRDAIQVAREAKGGNLTPKERRDAIQVAREARKAKMLNGMEKSGLKLDTKSALDDLKKDTGAAPDQLSHQGAPDEVGSRADIKAMHSEWATFKQQLFRKKDTALLLKDYADNLGLDLNELANNSDARRDPDGYSKKVGKFLDEARIKSGYGSNKLTNWLVDSVQLVNLKDNDPASHQQFDAAQNILNDMWKSIYEKQTNIAVKDDLGRLSEEVAPEPMLADLKKIGHKAIVEDIANNPGVALAGLAGLGAAAYLIYNKVIGDTGRELVNKGLVLSIIGIGGGLGLNRLSKGFSSQGRTIASRAQWSFNKLGKMNLKQTEGMMEYLDMHGSNDNLTMLSTFMNLPMNVIAEYYQSAEGGKVNLPDLASRPELIGNPKLRWLQNNSSKEDLQKTAFTLFEYLSHVAVTKNMRPKITENNEGSITNQLNGDRYETASLSTFLAAMEMGEFNKKSTPSGEPSKNGVDTQNAYAAAPEELKNELAGDHITSIMKKIDPNIKDVEVNDDGMTINGVGRKFRVTKSSMNGLAYKIEFLDAQNNVYGAVYVPETNPSEEVKSTDAYIKAHNKFKRFSRGILSDTEKEAEKMVRKKLGDQSLEIVMDSDSKEFRLKDKVTLDNGESQHVYLVVGDIDDPNTYKFRLDTGEGNGSDTIELAKSTFIESQLLTDLGKTGEYDFIFATGGFKPDLTYKGGNKFEVKVDEIKFEGLKKPNGIELKLVADPEKQILKHAMDSLNFQGLQVQLDSIYSEFSNKFKTDPWMSKKFWDQHSKVTVSSFEKASSDILGGIDPVDDFQAFASKRQEFEDAKKKILGDTRRVVDDTDASKLKSLTAELGDEITGGDREKFMHVIETPTYSGLDYPFESAISDIQNKTIDEAWVYITIPNRPSVVGSMLKPVMELAVNAQYSDVLKTNSDKESYARHLASVADAVMTKSRPKMGSVKAAEIDSSYAKAKSAAGLDGHKLRTPEDFMADSGLYSRYIS